MALNREDRKPEILEGGLFWRKKPLGSADSGLHPLWLIA
jgi:hypothetical protein